MPSVNQLNTQIKLFEVWKSQHSERYPLKWAEQNELSLERRMRGSNDNQKLHEKVGSKILNSTFKWDAVRVWNRAPVEIKTCASIFSAKKLIKNYCRTLPI